MKKQLKNPLQVYTERCPVIHTLEVIGGKWRIPIIWHISDQKSIRYNELKRCLPGITNIMLTRCLRSLEDYGLVKRTDYNTIPPHVEYSLTDFCEELLPVIHLINEWSLKASPMFTKCEAKMNKSKIC